MNNCRKGLPVTVVVLTIFFLLALPHFSIAFEQEVNALSSAMAESIAKADKKLIAVVDFTDLSGNVTELGRFLAEEFSVALAGSEKGFEVVDRTHLKSIIAEHKLSATGLIDPQTARKLGKIAGVEALITGTITPFGESVRISVKILDTATAKVIGATRGNIAKTQAIDELLAREITTGQPFSQPASSPSYVSSPRNTKPNVVEDSYLRITVLNVTKSGNKFVNIRLLYENITDKEIKIQFGAAGYINNPAILFDDLGNKSYIGYRFLPNLLIPPKGKKQVGLGFEFNAKELGKIFSLNINHTSNPPGPISFVNLVAR